MRHSIARALVACLHLILAAVLPATGKRRAEPSAVPAEPCAPTTGPWAKPWTGPSSADARAIFRAEETMPLTPVQRERRFAVEFAARGVEYPYRYPDDQFSALGRSA
ncbi:hypothetical protein DVK44_11750 [Streptomyces paludis]|uniref:Uncharacterized protein n=1 Tax=Streptomyces paludis TaxID=2282738 RepID=A0A345HNJ3_9ACTN|nr:hypothetical protein DVK44_11750 [Streptomyces paludis]